MSNKRYGIYLFERKAVCPNCSGMLMAIGEALRYRCIDCKSAFKIVDMGLTENEVVCEQIKRKEVV